MINMTRINVWLYNFLNNYVFRIYDLFFNKIVRAQLRNLNTIPVIIINYNQLFYLKQLVNFLISRGFTNIVIIDNKSSYPPLLEYYKEIDRQVKIEYMKENYGHLVYYENEDLQKKYGKGFFILTDSDIVPNPNLPKDFLKIMLNHLKKHWKNVTKVGFALRLDDIPEQNQLKNKIFKWENKFWTNKIGKEIYDAPLDTTFSLYKPSYPKKYNQIQCFAGHRFAGNFVARHGGWYIDQKNMTKEQDYYFKSASSSSSWLQDEKNID